MTTRKATHAGSWYTDHGPSLSAELDGWLSEVDYSTIEDEIGMGEMPRPGARVIIAP